MKVLIQRVLQAQVDVDGIAKGQIGHGLLVFVGIEKQDNAIIAKQAAERILRYRVFSDGDGKMNLNVGEVEGGVLAISQFTLAANTQKGLRPSFSSAMPPVDAYTIYEQFMEALAGNHNKVEAGVFGADMQVQLINDGPVTFLLEIP